MLSNFNREAVKSVRSPDLASDHKAFFEFKKVFVMPLGRLHHFHGAMIEVEIEVQGRQRSICGKGNYDASDPDLGPVLKILVVDPSGDFEFLITESRWSGCFESSNLPGCDYRISLANCTPC